MNNFWRRAKPFVWGALCVTLALYFSPLNVIIGYTISTQDVSSIWAVLFDPYASVMQFLLGIILTFAAFCVVLTNIVEALGNRRLPPLRFYFAALFCVLFIAPFIYLRSRLTSNWPARRAGLEASATRAKPLIAAIEKYKANEGHAPENLQVLVPQYIVRVPHTGMVSYPDFRYSRFDWRDNASYILRVNTGFALSYESFIYFSNQKYPARLYGGRVERIGAWAYVHKSVLSE